MPIVVGVARSGTTLLRLMLDAHPELAMTHEAGFVPTASNLTNPTSRIFYRRIITAVTGNPRGNNLREAFYQTLTGFVTWGDFHIPSEILRQELDKVEPFTITEGIRTFFRLYAGRFNKPRWGDKTPFYVRHLKSVENVLPEAHFIHIIRDGRDAALSGKGLHFVNGDFEAIGSDWSNQILAARRQSGLCRHYLEVRYEDLVRTPTVILQGICRFLNLKYDPRMERYYLGASERMDELQPGLNPDGSVAYSKESRLFRHRLTSKPPELSRIGVWKKEMKPEDLAAFNKSAGPLLRTLGYQ